MQGAAAGSGRCASTHSWSDHSMAMCREDCEDARKVVCTIQAAHAAINRETGSSAGQPCCSLTASSPA